jgi:hypothetical protein
MCTKCEKLGAERKRLKHAYESACLNLRSSATRRDQARFMTLKTLTDEAQIDLELVETEISLHQALHAVPRGPITGDEKMIDLP